MPKDKTPLEFIRECSDYLADHPGDVPFDAITGHLVLGWMLARVEAFERADANQSE